MRLGETGNEARKRVLQCPYYSRNLPSPSMPERESFGLRFFSPSRAMSQRRQMKAALSTTCKKLQERIGELEREGAEPRENAALLRTFLPKSLRWVLV